jgi:hypothetical protein
MPRAQMIPQVEMLQCYPVSTRVNALKNDAPDLIAPAPTLARTRGAGRS